MVGTKWIYRLIKSIYSLKNIPFSRCDLVVSLGYGLLNRDKLPDAAKKTLREAVQIASKHRVPIAWASANYFWPGCVEEEDRLKMAEASAAGLAALPIISKGVTNSVTEAQGIRQAALRAGIEFRSKTIVVVADWPHARSARKIWRQVFPEAIIVMVSIDGEWNEHHPCFFQRSGLRWLAINIIRHLALIILGIEKVGQFQQPMKK